MRPAWDEHEMVQDERPMKNSVVSCGSSRSDYDKCAGKVLRELNRMSLQMRDRPACRVLKLRSLFSPDGRQTIMYL